MNPRQPSEGHETERKRTQRVYQGSHLMGVMSDDVRLEQSFATVVTSKHTTLSQSAAGVIIGESVEANSSACLFVIAGEVRGNLRPIFSTAGALLVAGATLLGWALYGRTQRPKRRR